MANENMKDQTPIHVLKNIEERILSIRGVKVMVDSDLADLYGVTTKRLNEQVKRNNTRFPDDFMFRLTDEEKKELVANCDHLSKLKFSPVSPNVFTEHGAIMAASVLNTERAVGVSLYVVRAFIKLREMYAFNQEFSAKLSELDRKVTQHDGIIKSLVNAIKKMATPTSKRKIGFH